MKEANVAKLTIVRMKPIVGLASAVLPGLVWSHPGHGLEGLWVHDVLHVLTAVCTIALAALLAVGFIRRRRYNKRR